MSILVRKICTAQNGHNSLLVFALADSELKLLNETSGYNRPNYFTIMLRHEPSKLRLFRRNSQFWQSNTGRQAPHPLADWSHHRVHWPKSMTIAGKDDVSLAPHRDIDYRIPVWQQGIHPKYPIQRFQAHRGEKLIGDSGVNYRLCKFRCNSISTS